MDTNRNVLLERSFDERYDRPKQQEEAPVAKESPVQTNKKNQSNGIFKFLKDEKQNSILKTSEMNHIFNNKMRQNN